MVLYAFSLFAGTLTEALLLILANAFLPTVLPDSFCDLITILLSREHPENACCPIELTFAGIVMLFNAVQLRNASLPIFVNLDVNLTVFRFEQPWNAPFPMRATFFPITTFLIFLSPLKAFEETAVTLYRTDLIITKSGMMATVFWGFAEP